MAKPGLTDASSHSTWPSVGQSNRATDPGKSLVTMLLEGENDGPPAYCLSSMITNTCSDLEVDSDSTAGLKQCSAASHASGGGNFIGVAQQLPCHARCNTSILVIQMLVSHQKKPAFGCLVIAQEEQTSPTLAQCLSECLINDSKI